MGGLNANVTVRSSNDSCARQMERVHEYEPDDSLHEGRTVSHLQNAQSGFRSSRKHTDNYEQTKRGTIHHYTISEFEPFRL